MSLPPKEDAKFEHLLEYLRQSRGFDFTGYKRPSLMRRMSKHMQTVHVDRFTDYVDYLEVHPEEFAVLFNTILINVTSFFRDQPAWDFLAGSVVPRIIQNKGADDFIRIWSAGCATGEEAYAIAMLMAEALGKEGFRQRVKIYATDVDEDALATARQAGYGAKEIQPVPEEFRQKYFDAVGSRYVFNSDLRRSVIFGRHDLVQDAPMSRLDLLVCRNTLMYFNAETQGRILSRFHYALNADGFLFLGKAEVLLIQSSLFTPVELKCRIFSKSPQVTMRDRLLVFAQTGAATEVNPVELRSLIEQANAERKVITAANVEQRFKNGDPRYLDVAVTPLQDNGVPIGVCISFNDVTRYQRLEDDIQRAKQDADTVNEELQAANEELQSINEELEATNEELQSTNEELETTNEELQSTNEELETMNEELQSTNEELNTINEELRERTDELNHSNAFLNSILFSLRGGVVVVDRNNNVLIWNYMAEDLWGLRAEEIKGQSLMNLDIGLPVGQLREPIRACLSQETDQQEMILDAVNRRGSAITPFRGPKGEPQGAMLMMEEMGM
jgi:two-component system, chemotaxis family, CheB/CheR fusion protein